MTIPVERRRALDAAHELLVDLLDPAKTPKVPRAIRERASRVLRHHPGQLFDWYYKERPER
jgi:hypothetical protein